MTRWIDRLLAAVGVGGRKPEADVSWEPAKRGPGQDDTSLGATGDPEGTPPQPGNAGPSGR
jgi:hypothetical protein